MQLQIPPYCSEPFVGRLHFAVPAGRWQHSPNPLCAWTTEDGSLHPFGSRKRFQISHAGKGRDFLLLAVQRKTGLQDLELPGLVLCKFLASQAHHDWLLSSIGSLEKPSDTVLAL